MLGKSGLAQNGEYHFSVTVSPPLTTQFHCTDHGDWLDINRLVKSAVQASRNACANALDVHMNKLPLAHALHTTAGLSNAKSNNAPTGENKVFISVECSIKSSAKRGQGGTDPDCGSWGKPWSKDDYLSGHISSPSLSAFVHSNLPCLQWFSMTHSIRWMLTGLKHMGCHFNS